jgi:NAD(P)-dependent dehydrogenase (short-subunit alcohol dehydrogenase family)
MSWIAQLSELRLSKSAQICVLSARVGSISDNRLGGWYGYRSTKAALNMMVKCAGIELKRKHKDWQLVLFHPGTTDTPLSEPFQQNVAAKKLFSAKQTAHYLHQVLQQMRLRQQTEAVDYVDWQGKTIPW